MLPILVVFFNRPTILNQCIDNLRKIKPRILFFSSDGPRKNFKDDYLFINNCKKLISKIDWKSDIYFLNSEINFGCDEWVPKSISWFFDNVQTGLILEDDCLISKDFYDFSSAILEKYKNNERIMNISAANFHNEKWGNSDYYFSAYPANWGWATTALAWKKYCGNMEGLDNFLSNLKLFTSIIPDQRIRDYWRKFFNGLESKKYTYWDAKWTYSIWKNNGLSVTPNYNLVNNIGFGENATHTKCKEDMYIPIQAMPSNLSHPYDININYDADRLLYHLRYKPNLKSYFQKSKLVINDYFRKI
jgi:hypothetical protein